MLAKELFSNDIIPLRTSDSGDEALGIMSDFYVRHLPIVNNKQLLGLLSEEDILNQDTEEPIGSYQLSNQGQYVKENAHIYEVLTLMSNFNLTVIPVVDEGENYVGMITLEDALHYFSKNSTFTEPGGIVVLSMQKHNYSLAEIARIVESENTIILSAMVSSERDASTIRVTLKLNRNDLQHVLAAFERFEYDIEATFQEYLVADSLKDRYDSLIHYLNV